MDERKIVLIHVTDDPDVGDVGNCEEVRRIVQRLHSGRRSYILFRDDARNGRINIHQSAWLVHVRAKQPQSLDCSLDGYLGLCVCIFRDLQILLRDRPLVIKQLGPVQLRVRKFCVGHSLAVLGEGLRNI